MALSTTLTFARLRLALLDLAKFDGKVYYFNMWLLAIKAKIRVDGAALSDLIAQFYYIYNRLELIV